MYSVSEGRHYVEDNTWIFLQGTESYKKLS
jgi:hypothetical protein